MKQLLKKLALLYYRLLLRHVTPSKKHIVFVSSVGRSLSGSPAAICRCMLKDPFFKGCTFTWVITDKTLTIPEDLCSCKYVVQNSPAYFKAMAKAGIWVSDGRLADYLIKRPEVLYLQTWHGTPLKKLALDMDKLYMSENKALATYHEEFRRNTTTWDGLISQNHYSSEIFRRCFAFDKAMLEIGYPRNDIMFQKSSPEALAALRKQYHLPLDKKILLYAPTWRDDQFYANGIYKFVSALDFDQMYRALSDEYVLIIKYHYLVKEHLDFGRYHGFIRTFSADTDITDLYLVSDLLVTDYSSAMFDYTLLHRPVLFFVPDLETYRSDLRGFYFDLFADAPGPISTTTDALCTAITQYDPALYQESYQAFCKRFHSFDDGHAAEHAVAWIKQQL